MKVAKHRGSNMNKKRILLTGGFGYIGSTFIERYFNRYSITALDVNYFGYPKKLESKTTNMIIKDIRDISLADLKNIEIVIHMSELSNDPMGEIDPSITKDINVLGTKKLIDLCNKSNISKFIYMSSCSVYGFNEEFANENSKVNPLTEYAKSKVKNEDYILNFSKDYEVKILRNATAFGFSNNHRLDLVVNDLVYSAIKNNEINVLSDGSPIRPVVHIVDICRVIKDLIETDSSKKLLLNVGHNLMNYSIKDIAMTISNLTNIDNLSFGKLDGDKRSYKVDFSYLEKSLPDFVFKYDLEKGINDLLRNYDAFDEQIQSKRIDQLNHLVKNQILNKEFRFV